MRFRKINASLFVFLLLLPACASRRPGDPVRPGFNIYSQDQDVQLGRQVAQQVVQQVDVVRDSRLQQYVRDLGNRLARQPQAQQYPYEFTLINDPSINAFALPGGPIFIHTGLIANADNEGQLVGVFAHEIAHVALRHGTSQASKASVLQVPAALAGVALGQGAGAQIAGAGLGLTLNAVMLKYSRGAEEEADALGAQLMANAGYNPIEMARFFEKLEAQGGSRAPQFLSSHPSPGNRVRNVEAEIQAMQRRNYSQGSNSAFNDAKRRVAQLPPPQRRMQ